MRSTFSNTDLVAGCGCRLRKRILSFSTIQPGGVLVILVPSACVTESWFFAGNKRGLTP